MIDVDPAEAKAALEAISKTSRSSLAEVRRILGALRTDSGGDPATTRRLAWTPLTPLRPS